MQIKTAVIQLSIATIYPGPKRADIRPIHNVLEISDD